MLATLLTISLLHWVVLVTPGANVLLVSQLAASGHKRSAYFASLGISFVAVAWAILAILGIQALFAALPQLRMALQIAGGLYLLYIAVRLWRSASSTPQGDDKALPPWSAFQLGFLTNIMNPKSALFFGSLFATSVPAHASILLLTMAVAIVFINALCWHLFLALAFSHPRVRAGYANKRILLNKVAGAIVGALGLRLLMNTAVEWRKSWAN